MWLKQTLTWVENEWIKFEAWVASLMPGLKTRTVTGLSAIGSIAAAMSDYFAGLPLSEFMTGTQIAVGTAILFTLSFWLRGLGDRASARVSSPTS